MRPASSVSSGSLTSSVLPPFPTQSPWLPGGNGHQVPLGETVCCFRCFPSLWWVSGGALMRKARYQGNAPTFRDQEPQSQVERPQSMTCGAPVPIGWQPDGNQWGMCNGQGRERSPAGCPDPSRDRSWLRAILSQLRLPQSRIQKRTKSEPHNLIISLPLPWLSPGSWLSSSKTPSRWDKNRRGILDLISPVLGASAFV